MAQDNDQQSTPGEEADKPQAAEQTSGKQIVRAKGRALVGKPIRLAGRHIRDSARSFQHAAGPRASRTTAIVKRRTSQVAVRLRRIGLKHVAPGLGGLVRSILRRLSPRSLARDYRRLLLFFHSVFLDRRADSLFFVRTRGHVRLARLTVPSQLRPTGHDYRPTPCLVFQWAMTALPESLEQCAFVDYGAGRGRVLLLASHFPFEKIIGAEIAQELHDDCLMNIAQYPRSLMKCRDIECRRTRATTLPIPELDSVFYFFNPFDSGVFEKVLARIVRSYKRNRREMHLICVDMDEAEAVAAEGIFHPVKFPRKQRLKLALFSPYSVRVYKTEA